MDILIAITATLGVVALALLIAIRLNGPLVLDTVDRLAGGSRGVTLLEKANFGPQGAQALRVYGMEGTAPDAALPVFLFVHGGGWDSGDPAHYEFVARALTPEGFIVVNAGYRLHPEAVYPAMVEDAASAIAWTHRNIAQFGGDPGRIILAGHSAGAYNIVMAALDRQWLAREGLEPAIIAGVAGLAGPFDFYPFTRDSARNSFGHAEEPELTQPVNFAHGNAPPMLLLHGEEDETVKPRNSRALARLLAEAGSQIELEVYPEFDHTDPIIALASPWRNRRPILGKLVKFGHSLQASVPVQGEKR